MTTAEAAVKWGISRRRINTLCKEGRIPGATLHDFGPIKAWIIPEDFVYERKTEWKRGRKKKT